MSRGLGSRPEEYIGDSEEERDEEALRVTPEDSGQRRELSEVMRRLLPPANSSGREALDSVSWARAA